MQKITCRCNDTDCPQDSCNDVVNRPAVVKKIPQQIIIRIMSQLQ